MDTPPQGYVEVSKADFFGLIYARKLNVHPRCERHFSIWEMPNRSVFGRTYPGYLGDAPNSYWLRSDLKPWLSELAS